MPVIQAGQAKQAMIKIQNSDIPIMTNQISGQLDQADQLVSSLRTWMRTLDPKTYNKIEPYTKDMLSAYNDYKTHAKAVAPARKAYTDLKNQLYNRETDQQCVQLAGLAIQWGRLAVTSAETRLNFLKKYRNAYQFQNIDTHIQAAEDMVRSGRSAVTEARSFYNKIYEKEARQQRKIDPAVFR